jgi:hypothetical protein
LIKLFFSLFIALEEETEEVDKLVELRVINWMFAHYFAE